MTPDLKSLLPRTKHDRDAVANIATVGYPTIAPLIDDLMFWVADGNWPIAVPVARFLVSLGEPVIPALKAVLRGRDAGHQCFALSLVAAELSPDLIRLLQADLQKLCDFPTPDQITEGVPEEAAAVLARGRI